MKRIILIAVASVLLSCLGYNFVVPSGIAAETDGEVVVPRQYVALAKMLADSRGDMDKAVEITSKAVSSVVEKGKNYEEKLALLSEISSCLVAAVANWSDADKIVIVSTIVKSALALAPDGDEGDAERTGFVRQVFAALRFASSNSISLVSALEVVPENLKDVATYGIENAMAVLDGAGAWRCKDIYDAVITALEGEDAELPRLSEAMIVTVSTTTTTSTSTTTTTTSIPGAAIPGSPSQPSPVPTTKPSPTPVGRR